MKDELRQEFTNRISLLSAANMRRKNEIIRQSLILSVDWHAVRSLHVYKSVPHLNEVDTSWLSEYIAKNHPNIHCDVGIFKRRMPIPREQYDVIVVPLIAFDEACNRLGRGGGWYDRFLATQIQTQAIGLAYSEQFYRHVMPTEPHDVPLDMIVTESHVLKR